MKVTRKWWHTESPSLLAKLNMSMARAVPWTLTWSFSAPWPSMAAGDPRDIAMPMECGNARSLRPMKPSEDVPGAGLAGLAHARVCVQRHVFARV